MIYKEAHMDYSFPRYLLAKQTVDDRALNKDVVQVLRLHLPAQPVTIVEVGAGIGTMLKRLVDWEILCTGSYTLVDSQEENHAYAQEWIPQWAREAGMDVERAGANELYLGGQGRDIRVRLARADVFKFVEQNEPPADLLIAHAFLDLLPMPAGLERLLRLTNGLAWLTINFDGLSTLEPEIDAALDEQIEWVYHQTMDTLGSGRRSRTGRKLFEHLRALRAEILAAGASDWVVHARAGSYLADEKYFLQFILRFFESSLQDSQALDGDAFKGWLARRHEQIECGELVYIAHQMDYLIRKDV
jgi:hypothetical protein